MSDYRWGLFLGGFRQVAVRLIPSRVGLVIDLLFGFVAISVYEAVFAAKSSIGGLGLGAALLFVWVAQLSQRTMQIWAWNDVSRDILRSSSWLTRLRPATHQSTWKYWDLGVSVGLLTTQALPTFVIGVLIIWNRIPAPGPANWVEFALALVIGILVAFRLRYLFNLMSAWTGELKLPSYIAMILMTFLSGFALPLAFLPRGVYWVLVSLPFAALVQVPAEILTGANGIPWYLLLTIQAGWLVLLGRVAAVAEVRAFRRVGETIA